MHVDKVILLFVGFFLRFGEISVFEAGKSLTDKVHITRKRMVACSIHFRGGLLWKSNVKRRKSVLTLLVEIERV